MSLTSSTAPHLPPLSSHCLMASLRVVEDAPFRSTPLAAAPLLAALLLGPWGQKDVFYGIFFAQVLLGPQEQNQIIKHLFEEKM